MKKLLFVVALLAGALAGCSGCRKDTAVTAQPADAGADAEADDEVRAVYPKDDRAPADPLASRLCKALHDVEEDRRAACCTAKPGIVFTGECTRTLTASLRDKAVTLASSDVDACAAAIEKTYAGCDWVGPFPPGPPAACLGILHGTIGAGHACRSSLECAGGNRCVGAGPTALGKCGPARNEGVLCGGSVDVLATYVRQTNVDTQHPECRGFCNRSECAAIVLQGGACTVDAACGAGSACVKNVCVKGATSSEPAKKPSGASCKNDFECQGGCVNGTCGMKCGIR